MFGLFQPGSNLIIIGNKTESIHDSTAIKHHHVPT